MTDFIVLSSGGAISMSNIGDTFSSDWSWSRSLTHLRLKQSNPTNPLNCLSIAALCFIADACPNLKSLEISVFRPNEPKKQIAVNKNGEEHDLKNLVFLNLPGIWEDTTSLPIRLIAILEHLFPSMAVPNYTGGKRDKPGALTTREAWWEDMWRMCQTMKDRRKMSSNLYRYKD